LCIYSFPHRVVLYYCTYMYAILPFPTEYSTSIHHGNDLITPSKATSAMAFAGNALRKHGRNPRQYPLHPLSLPTATAASFHRRNRLSPSPSAPPKGSVMIRCFTTSDGY